MSVILLADIDAFFAQAEQVKRPELRGRPVIVGGRATDRSVVASASYEARARGVKTAMPVAQAVRVCPDGVFLRGDFATYSQMSQQFRDVCLQHTPLVEQVSLDEAYLDLSGCRRRYARLL
ncbi:MAG TPA: DNA polymerase IV, partial [Phycisphaerae bacterium]|nr:DNA polymerase IV [Phycisphaerae bacterium]